MVFSWRAFGGALMFGASLWFSLLQMIQLMKPDIFL
jgi:hypothetical protein